MNRLTDHVTRRSFLSVPAGAFFAAAGPAGPVGPGGHYFAYDHVIGTSLDLVVWTSRAKTAELANAAALGEIHRLTSVLDTRDSNSEISRFERSDAPAASCELADVLAAYDHWAHRTQGLFSVCPRGANTPRNVDALGKAYIAERAAAQAAATPGVTGVLLNIGGDIVVRGRPCDIAVADPQTPHDNARPLTRVRIHNAAVATSGSYTRGFHLYDARFGRPAVLGSSATVVAADAVTANALATTLCLMDADQGLELVEQTALAEALHVGRDGALRRTSGFWRLERWPAATVTAAPAWPPGFQLTLSLILTRGQDSGRGRRGPHRPFVAVWIETTSGKLIRVLAFWASEERFYDELSNFWSMASRNQYPLAATARATREPGKYQLVWDGLDDDRKPVPPGSYRIVVETNQERGAYGKQSGVIVCDDAPASLTLPATANFEPVLIQYGPKPTRT